MQDNLSKLYVENSEAKEALGFHIDDFLSNRKYGEIIIKFEAGNITHCKITEVITRKELLDK